VSQEPEATGPGIVVLSPSFQVLHINQRAIALLNQLEHAAQSIGAEWALTAPLHQHCQNIMETLQARLGSNNWEQFRQHCTIGDSTYSIFVNGFGLPDRRGLPHSRIVMLLSPHNPVPMPGIRGEALEMAGGEQKACTTHAMIAPQPPIQGLPISIA
jgi:hypothetical protein